MANLHTFAQAIRVGVYTADPAGLPDGSIIYRSDLNEFRILKGGSWATVTTGSVFLTGQSLSQYNVIVGNGSNVSATVDSNSVGDILVDATNGLTIKAGSIVNADINASAAIALSKLAAVTASRALVSDASGFVSASSVTSTELGYVSGVTSAIQTQLGNKIDSSEKGANNGVATLDAGGKIPVAQLPNSVMEYKGSWDASTNSPTLADGVGNAGDVYLVSVAGTQNLGSGAITFAQGDWVVYSGTIWEKSINSNAVVSVNGQTGIVSLSTTDIAEGTNLYFTDERAQDAVGAMAANSSKVSLTYVDATPSLTADIVAGSLVNADINASAAIAHSKMAALTASRALTSDVSGVVSASSVTSTELGYVSGVTSAIQTQIDGKASTALSNLAAVAINTSLVSDTDNTDDLGSAAINWKDAHAKRIVSSDDLAVESTSGNVNVKSSVFKRSKDGSNFIEQEYVHNTSLSNNVADQPIAAFQFAHASVQGLEIEYSIKEATSNRVRIGKVSIVTNGTDISCVDSYNETADVGITFSAAINGANVEVRYTSTNSGNARTLRGDLKRFLV